MGGTQEMIGSSKQYDEVRKELRHVNFYIFFSRPGNGVVDFDVLYEKIVSEICSGLDKHGVKSYTVYGVGGGGGGLETLVEIIKKLWESKDFILFLWSLVTFLKGLYIKYLNNKVEGSYPEVSVHFRVETENKLDKIYKDDLLKIIKETLANLLLVTNAILFDLYEMFRIINFNLSVEVRLNKIGFSSAFNLPQKYREKREMQVLRLIKKIKIEENTQYNFKLKPFYFIEKNIKKADGDGKMVSKKSFHF